MVALTILLDGVAYGMLLFIISVGLTVTMGLMRVVNLAHGCFAMIGGYVAAKAVSSGVPFFAAALLAALVAGVVGAIAEVLVYRPLYRKGELVAGGDDVRVHFRRHRDADDDLRLQHQAAADA